MTILGDWRGAADVYTAAELRLAWTLRLRSGQAREAAVSPLAERQTRLDAALREISWLRGDRDRLGGVASPVGDLF